MGAHLKNMLAFGCGFGLVMTFAFWALAPRLPFAWPASEDTIMPATAVTPAE